MAVESPSRPLIIPASGQQWRWDNPKEKIWSIVELVKYLPKNKSWAARLVENSNGDSSGEISNICLNDEGVTTSSVWGATWTPVQKSCASCTIRPANLIDQDDYACVPCKEQI